MVSADRLTVLLGFFSCVFLGWRFAFPGFSGAMVMSDDIRFAGYGMNVHFDCLGVCVVDCNRI